MRRTPILALAGCLLSATNVAAQICVGLPLTGRQSALAGVVTFADQTTTIGGQFTHQTAGPLALGGGVGIVTVDGVDDNGVALNGTISHDVRMTEVNGCVVSGVQVTSFSTRQFVQGTEFEADTRLMVIPFGFGIGKSLPAGGSTALILSGVPQLLLVRQSLEISVGGFELDESDSEVEFGINLGATLASPSLFGGLVIGLTSIDGQDAVFSLSLGFRFGDR